jgi:hypothetical protein
MKFDALALIRNGGFGDIRVGSSPQQVQQCLGAPDAVSRGKPPKIWRYGNVQITLYPVVMLVVIQLSESSTTWHPSIELSGWIPQRNMNLADFEAILRAEQIEMLRDPELSFDDQENFFIGVAGVSALFVDRVIDRFSLSSRRLSGTSA